MRFYKKCKHLILLIYILEILLHIPLTRYSLMDTIHIYRHIISKHYIRNGYTSKSMNMLGLIKWLIYKCRLLLIVCLGMLRRICRVSGKLMIKFIKITKMKNYKEELISPIIEELLDCTSHMIILPILSLR